MNKPEVTVVDAVMGTGKSTWIIEKINEEVDTKFIVVLPLLSEVARFKNELEREIVEPIAQGNSTKLSTFKDGIKEGKSLVTTHALFERFDPECYDLIKEGGYTLVLDETVTMVEPVGISKADMRNLIAGEVLSRKTQKGIKYYVAGPKADDYIQDPGSKFKKEVMLAATQHLMNVQDMTVVLCMNPKKFSIFNEVFMLTYLFEGSETDCWFQLFSVPYKHMRLIRYGSGHLLINHDKSYSGVEFKPYINIISDDKYNKIGDRHTALSKSWYEKAKADTLGQLSSSWYNICRYRYKAESEDILWTTFTAMEKKLTRSPFKWVSTPGYKYSDTEHHDWLKCFLPFNTRATNKFDHKNVLGFLVNVFPHTLVEKFFKDRGLVMNRNNHALSHLIQWVFRAAIRKADSKGHRETIELFIPSKRMRELLSDWLHGTNIRSITSLAETTT